MNEKTLKIKITEKCNFHCSYCAQSLRARPRRDFRQLDSLERLLQFLGRDWVVDITGGEPFSHPLFLRIVRLLVKHEMAFQIGTNLSAPLEAFEALSTESCGFLRTARASLHLEYFAFLEFRDKLRHIANMLGDGTRVGARLVVSPGFAFDLSHAERTFAEAGLSIKFQPRRWGGEVLDLSPDERAAINATDNHNPLDPESFKGKKCLAGSLYMRADISGNVFPCNEFAKLKRPPLFNMIEDPPRLLNEPVICPTANYCCAEAGRKGLVIDS